MIYLFNNREELVHIIAEEDLVEFTHTVKINAFDEAEFEVALSVDRSVFEGVAYFGFFTREQVFGMFKLYSFEINQGYLIKGLDRAESDLRTVGIIKDKRPKNVTADQALTVALEGTGYHLGEVRGLTHVNSLNFYYISPREALVKIIEAFNCEFRVRYTFVENKVIGRYIDLYKKQGIYTGVQFEYGDNALEVVYEENSDDVVTALIGRGKGEETTDENGESTGGYGRRIEFTDVVWSKSAGKPVDKPAGQNYVVLMDDFEEKGLFQDGSVRHRWGVYVNEDITDKELLLQRTFEELERLNSPLRIYKAEILDIGSDIWLGDRIGIVRDEVGVAFEARIFKIVIDKLNFDQSSVELGDYETLKNHQNSSSQAVRDAINEAFDEYSEALEAFNKRLQEEIERKNKEFDEKVRIFKLEFDNGMAEAKNQADNMAAGIRDEIQLVDDKATELKKAVDKLTQRDEDSLAEFDKKIADLRKQSLTPEAIDKALQDAGFKDSMDDIRKQLSTVSQTAKVNAELIGGDGSTSYNKNRLLGATSQDVTGDYIEVGHNGDGFEVGKSYVISWSAVCRPYGRQDVVVEVLTAFVGSGAVKLVPVDTRFPTIDKTLTKKKDSLLEVYLGQYRASFSGDWYQPVSELVTVSDSQMSWQIRPSFKTVADGQSATYDGEWSDTPTVIFDGGGS